ncbi:septal ring lytic transglycosylase RlpA family protein [Longimycelium tulufanense]|uniref:septal ring lytic transglycosylase RlpA family protein n=1 Tax=Longimycelium tulufanense TaxID=907463 RepID=UPI0027E54B75|nr:septal ring lytic transglycosylase RlpA family protein [Longimycelium tulufanense]
MSTTHRKRTAAVATFAAFGGVLALAPAATADPGPSPLQPRESCQASWYSTRSGGYTAAHRTLPMGTKARVTNRRNGKSVVVTITDRGPFVRGRCVDLSKQAFAAIAPLSQGVAPVTVRRI